MVGIAAFVLTMLSQARCTSDDTYTAPTSFTAAWRSVIESFITR